MNILTQALPMIVKLLVCCLIIVSFGGCSSLGLSTWPANYQLLAKTKEFAAAAPRQSGMPNELSKMALPNYFIEPGDRILIEPVDLESKLGSFGDQKVQIDGSIDLGKFGRIRVTGMQVEDIEVAVEERIGGLAQREAINVQLTETNAAEVFVLGEVGSPAAYPLEGHEHVLDAILRAGGVTSKASPCDIILVRPTAPGQCRVVLPVCYRQITQVGDVTTNYQLQPGDRIVVGSRSFHEELAFWKQKKSCDRCCQSCCVECQPTNVQYTSRFAVISQLFGRPPLQKASTDIPNPIQAKPKLDSKPNLRKRDPNGSRPESQDNDLFLPSTNFSDASESK